MRTQLKKIAATPSAAAWLSVSAGSALAQGNDHGHSHDAGEPVQFTLNNGKKWATDDSLRRGMDCFSDALAVELPAIHSGMAAEQYRTLAQKTNDQIAFMVKKSKLEPKADAVPHLVLADIIAGADTMMGQGSSEAPKGAAKIAHALKNYAAHFGYPSWRGLE